MKPTGIRMFIFWWSSGTPLEILADTAPVENEVVNVFLELAHGKVGKRLTFRVVDNMNIEGHQEYSGADNGF